MGVLKILFVVMQSVYIPSRFVPNADLNYLKQGPFGTEHLSLFWEAVWWHHRRLWSWRFTEQNNLL